MPDPQKSCEETAPLRCLSARLCRIDNGNAKLGATRPKLLNMGDQLHDRRLIRSERIDEILRISWMSKDGPVRICRPCHLILGQIRLPGMG